jgi:glucokinase
MFLLFDIGGTTTRMGISQTGDKIDDVKLFPTNHDFTSAMEEMKNVANDFSGGEKYHAVVGGVRSYNKLTGSLFDHPSIPLWVNQPLLQAMKEAWGDVYIANDAVLVGLGEAVHGAGKGHKIVAYITLSTGVGGCRITNGKVDETVYSFEPGNMIVPGYDGKLEVLENIISGSAIEKKYGVSPFDLADETAWGEISENVAVGLNNVAVMWGPEIIVLGGSVPQKINFEKVNNRLKILCKIFPEVPDVIKAEIDEQGGLYGALAYLKNLP